MPGNGLYMDTANQLKIVSNGKFLNPNEYKIEMKGGSYTKTDSCIWVEVTSYVGHPYIKILDKFDSLVGEHSFSILPTPTFRLTIDGVVYPDNINKNVLLRMENIVPMTQWPMEEAELVSYKVKITTGNETRFFSCSKGEIPDSLRRFISMMKAASTFSLYNPVIQGCNRQLMLWSWTPTTTYEVNGYDTYFKVYSNLFFDFSNKEDDYDSLAKHFIPYLQGFNDFDRVTETNCTGSNDTCTTNIYFMVNGMKQLALQYHYLGNYYERVELYNNEIRIAEMNFYKNRLLGYFNVNFPDGSKKVEGYYKLEGDTVDTFTYWDIKYRALKTKEFKHEKEVKAGLWKFYRKGNLVNQIKY